ncbi:MAG: HD domain-containing phosphohydrolase, partial [Halobacteriales archaeon]|nr:HD domain-containing phosphohydrolase [Halobacteriales archaeon]
LHDIGMVSTRETWENEHSFPPRVFFRAVKPHPEIGFRQLQEIPGMKDGIARAVLGEHERMDGSGYPDGLKGRDIHPGARILAVCDTLEALTHPRPHHEPISTSQAMARLQTLGKSTLDGEIVDLLTAELEELLRDVPEHAGTTD